MVHCSQEAHQVATMNKRDAENILRIKTAYTAADVRKAHHRLAKKYHPDANKKTGMDPIFAQAYMRVINEAADYLRECANRLIPPIKTEMPQENRSIYQEAERILAWSSTQDEFIEAAILFERSSYRDYEERRQECIDCAHNNHVAVSYRRALRAMQTATTAAAYRDAARMFEKASGYRDADSKRLECLRQADRLKAAEEERKRIEAEKRRKAEEEQRRKAEAERKKKTYDRAVKLATDNSLDSLREAAELFASIPGYNDSDVLLEKCKQEIERIEREEKYLYAVKLFKTADTREGYARASELFAELNGYKDSSQYVLRATSRIKSIDRFKTKTYSSIQDAALTVLILACLTLPSLLIAFSTGPNQNSQANQMTLQIQLLNSSGEVITTKEIAKYEVGQSYQVTAPKLKGYKHDSSEKSKKSFTCSRYSSNNVVMFTYLKKTSYSVSYIEKKSGKRIAKAVTKNTLEGKTATVKAKSIKGYTLLSSKTKKLKATSSKAKNKVTFYYKKTPVPSTQSYSSGTSYHSSSSSSNNYSSRSSSSSSSSSSSKSSSSSSKKNPFSK